jgi:DNA-binding GntR family transcriptional regulator
MLGDCFMGVYTLKNQVYDALLNDIVNGVYSIDTVLTEKFLMEKYNVSRAPIREALSQLIGTHILSSIPRQGYKILHLDGHQLFEIIKFRSSLEASFLESNHMYIDEAWLEELVKSNMDFANCPENDLIKRWHYNCQFHLKLFSIYGNNYAYKLLEDAVNFQTIYFVQNKHSASADLHVALIDYLRKGDITTALTILKADIEHLMPPSIFPTPIKK